MVATITAAVGGGRRASKPLRLVLWHWAGLALGASALAAAVSAVALAVPVPRVALAALVAVPSLAWGLAAAVGRPLPVATPHKQVPLAWRYAMTPAQYSFCYGVGLGAGVFTRIMSFSFYAFVGSLLLVRDPLLAVGIAQLYAAARVAPVVAALLVDRPAEELVEQALSWRAIALRFDGAVLVLAALAFALP
jgi:hypothetical protein